MSISGRTVAYTEKLSSTELLSVKFSFERVATIHTKTQYLVQKLKKILSILMNY